MERPRSALKILERSHVASRTTCSVLTGRLSELANVEYAPKLLQRESETVKYFTGHFRDEDQSQFGARRRVLQPSAPAKQKHANVFHNEILFILSLRESLSGQFVIEFFSRKISKNIKSVLFVLAIENLTIFSN